MATIKIIKNKVIIEGHENVEECSTLTNLANVLSESNSYTGVGGSIITTSAQALSTEVLPNVNYGNAGFMNITSVSDITPLYSN